MKKHVKNFGFTLAEVLITLVIIGVIGALTVPALIQNTQKQEYVSALKKAYSTLSQAAQQIIAEEGSPKGADSWLTDGRSVYEMYKKYLNVIKDCGSSAGCFTNGKTLNNTGTYNWDGSSLVNKIVLADGIMVLFESDNLTSNQCNLLENSSYCTDMLVDVNGSKGPNIIGRDIFSFNLSENGLVPRGCEINTCTGSSGDGQGFGCSCRVLSAGKIDY